MGSEAASNIKGGCADDALTRSLLHLDGISILHTAVVAASVVCSLFVSDVHPANVTLRWDWDYAQSAAAGFACYCGPSPRYYVTRVEAGYSDTVTLALPEGTIHFCSVRAYGPAGDEGAFSNEVAISIHEATGAATQVPLIGVAQGGVTPTPTGIRVVLTGPVEQRWLNLFSSEQGGEGPPDVSLLGASSGLVLGSLIIDEDRQALTFLKSRGVLLPDTYTFTIASRYDALTDSWGRPLDADGDGLTGDDYRVVFAVAPSDAPVLSIGEFARGPGQPVNLPADDTSAGIPVHISHAAAVGEVAFTLRYNPTLLSVRGVALASSISGVLKVEAMDPLAGVVRIRVTNLTGLTDASTVLVRLQAEVPAHAPYRSQHLLDLRDLEFNAGGLAGRDDDGLHVVANLGDATGEGRYSSSDPRLIKLVILEVDTGFSAYPLTDPIIVGDVNGTGRLESSDARLIQLKLLGDDVPQIPDVPN